MYKQLLAGSGDCGTFRFCQEDDLGIHVSAMGNSERVQPTECDAKQGETGKTTHAEGHQLRSVTRTCLDRQANTT